MCVLMEEIGKIDNDNRYISRVIDFFDYSISFLRNVGDLISSLFRNFIFRGKKFYDEKYGKYFREIFYDFFALL